MKPRFDEIENITLKIASRSKMKIVEDRENCLDLKIDEVTLKNRNRPADQKGWKVESEGASSTAAFIGTERVPIF